MRCLVGNDSCQVIECECYHSQLKDNTIKTYIYNTYMELKRGNTFGAWWNNWPARLDFKMTHGGCTTFECKLWMIQYYLRLLTDFSIWNHPHTHMDIFYCNRTRFSGSHSSLGNKIRNCDGCRRVHPCPRLWRPCTRLGGGGGRLFGACLMWWKEHVQLRWRWHADFPNFNFRK